VHVVVDIAVGIAMRSVVALLLVVAADAAAQVMPGERPAFGSMPSLALGLSPAGVRALNEEFDELHALGAFAGRSRRVDRFTSGDLEKPKHWMLYGRLGIFNFQDFLERERSDGVRITLKRTGPKLTGRFYIGIHREF
jgi:hypothetical protein